MKRQAGLAFILVTLLLDVLGFGLIIPIFPELIKEVSGKNTSDAALLLGYMVAIFSLVQFVFSPILGGLSDQYGRRPILLISLLGLALDYLLLAFAPTIGWIWVGRIIAGMTAANITAASAYIADVSAPEDRAKNFGMMGAVFSVGFIIGPAIGGFLGEHGTRLPFFFAAGLAFLNWLYGFFVLPESHKKENRKPFDIRKANPVAALGLLRKYRVVFNLTGMFLLTNLANQLLQNVWVLYTAERYGWGPQANGFSLTAVGVMGAIVQGVLVGVLIPKLGEKRAILLGLGLGVLQFIAFGLAEQGWMVYAIIVVGAIGGIAGPAIQGLVSRQVSETEQGSVQGALSGLWSLVSIVGPILATSIFAYFTRKGEGALYIPGMPFFVGALMMLLGTFIAIWAFRAKRYDDPMKLKPAED